MKPKDFKGRNRLAAKDQPQYMTLPVLVVPDRIDGMTISCWAFEPEELEQIKKTGCVWLTQLTMQQDLQPVGLSVERPFTPNEEATCRICGCTDEDCSQCIEKTGSACTWTEPDLCSACAPKLLVVKNGDPDADSQSDDG